ncbi:hypothetical protein DKG34_22200 [Streptomyces sp. NWU49]|uniref:hypothetical protein n=1 Tax=Streptomyces sp. NWU49 TaxID=2201153 RepID=UPI000D6821E3|nr:hypothetical protein [Streptomyces sp. NWU49]PWJ05475.1 hypothetical protein DKG34_22200 [Streptomyces sp. NWU49]
MTRTRRPLRELPCDPEHLDLTYTHRQSFGADAYGDTVEGWTVVVREYHEEWDECEGGCGTEVCERFMEEGREIGELHLWRLRDRTGMSSWEVANDDGSWELMSMLSSVLDPRTGAYSPEFQETVGRPDGDVLVLERVRLREEWRGFGLGPVLAAEAIRRLSAGCCAVLTDPGMTDDWCWPGEAEGRPVLRRGDTEGKLAALCVSIGFRPFRNGVHLLDLSRRGPAEPHVPGRAHLRALSHGYYEAGRAEE